MRRFLRDLWLFAKTRRRWWLLPLVVLCVLVAHLAFVLGHPAIAPFLYSIF